MDAERRTSRAFALPTVLLLTMVVGVAAAAMLSREADNRLMIERQLRAYGTHHMGKGVREVVGQWAISLSSQPLEKMIASDGHVLDLAMADGTLVRVSMADGQGSLLNDLARVPTSERVDAAAMIEALREVAGSSVEPDWVRPVGPVRVSAMGAPEAVLTAGARVATSTKGQATALVRAIMDARRDGEMTEATLNAAASRAGLTGDALSKFNRLFAPRPELWLLGVEVYPPAAPGRRADQPESRYRGRIVLGQAGLGTMNAGDSLGMFLTWEEVTARAIP
ncbi:MAG: hypothetical protein ACKVU4_14795 [Phycisphaerales bacterium]